jgi:SulP family sulfate permease
MKLFDLSHLRGDLFGGITAGIVALPLAMAFGVQSGLGAEAGLYGAIGIGIIAALFGGTATQVSGPTGPMTVISSLVVASAIERSGSLESGMVAVVLIFFLAGVFQVAFGLLQVGKLVQFIPYPVVSGFMSGIGLIIIFLQVFPMMGHASPNLILEVFGEIQAPLQNINWQAVLLGLITIAIIYLFPRITKSVPSALVALIAVSLIPQFVSMDVPKIGSIPEGLPHFNIGVFAGISASTLAVIVVPALTLAALGAIDSLLTSVVADNITKTRHNSNRELVGQGLGNMFASLIGGIPGAGATMRTVVNIRSGGKTKISGMIHGVFLLIVLLGVGRYAAEIPLAVLAGILITVGIGIIDYKGLRDIKRVPKTDALIMIVVMLMTVFVDLLWAVGAGLIMASLFFVKRVADEGEDSSTMGPIEDSGLENNDWHPLYKSGDVYVQELHGPLVFGFATKFQGQFLKVPDTKTVVFNMPTLTFFDQSGLYALSDVMDQLKEKNIEVIFSGLRKKAKEQLRQIGIIPNSIPEDHCFDTLDMAARWLKVKVKSEKATTEVDA